MFAFFCKDIEKYLNNDFHQFCCSVLCKCLLFHADITLYPQLSKTLFVSNPNRPVPLYKEPHVTRTRHKKRETWRNNVLIESVRSLETCSANARSNVHRERWETLHKVNRKDDADFQVLAVALSTSSPSRPPLLHFNDHSSIKLTQMFSYFFAHCCCVIFKFNPFVLPSHAHPLCRRCLSLSLAGCMCFDSLNLKFLDSTWMCFQV